MIKVITGAMFSGKSLRLIETIETYSEVYDLENFMFFKSKLDTRDNDLIKSRATDKEYKCIMIDDLKEIKRHIKENTKFVVIDEAQFLKGNVKEILKLHYKGVNFIIAGLNLTSEQKPFGIMPKILSIATDITVLKAECFFCGERAEYTKTNDKKTVDRLMHAVYYPVCKNCMNEVSELIKGEENE